MKTITGSTVGWNRSMVGMVSINGWTESTFGLRHSMDGGAKPYPTTIQVTHPTCREFRLHIISHVNQADVSSTFNNRMVGKSLKKEGFKVGTERNDYNFGHSRPNKINWNIT